MAGDIVPVVRAQLVAGVARRRELRKATETAMAAFLAHIDECATCQEGRHRCQSRWDLNNQVRDAREAEEGGWKK